LQDLIGITEKKVFLLISFILINYMNVNVILIFFI